MKWIFAIVCVVSLSTPVAQASCAACSFPSDCPITASLNPLRQSTHLIRSCPDKSYSLKVSSIRVASNDGTDHEFTVTAMDKDGYDDYSHGRSYSHYSELSTGSVSNTDMDTSCFQTSETLTLIAGTDLYVIIQCTNLFYNCYLKASIDFTCLPPPTPRPCRDISCGHGVCNNGQCVCNAGYIGSACLTQDLCYGISCNSRGVCNKGQCDCNAGYKGYRCQTVDLCYGISCNSRGVCNKGKCDCNAGYMGYRCQTVDLCYEVDCGLHGTCNNGYCDCDFYYSGNKCQYYDPCTGSFCFNGVCSSSTGVCNCFDGYEGYSCETETHAQSSNSKTIAIACSTVGVVVLVGLLVGAFVFYKRRKSRRQLDLPLVKNITLPQSWNAELEQPSLEVPPQSLNH